MDNSNTQESPNTTIYDSAIDDSTFSLLTGNDSANSFINLNENNSITDKSALNTNNKNQNLNFLHQSESSDNLEVDPKSNLANKTVFKTDNPNLSIIEINDNSTKSEEESVYLIDSDDEEHREKVRSILHSSKQKLNINTNSNTTTNVAATAPIDTAVAATSGPTERKTSPRVIKVYDNIKEFEKNLPETVKILTTSFGSKVYLVGTAHFSEESQDDVSFVIRNVKPDVVVVELCVSRIHILKHDEKSLLEEMKVFNLTKIRNIIRTNGLINGIFYIFLLNMSAQLTKDVGIAPGGEFRRAFDEIQKLSRCTLHLGDRPIDITLQRALRALSLWQTIKLVWRLTSTESTNIEEVEECKQQDLLEQLLQEMAGEFPAFSEVLVKERDLYLCHSLQVAALPTIQPNGLQCPINVVGVVGIGHTAGIVKNWMKVDSSKIDEILEIPPPRLSTRIFKYTMKIGFCGLFAYGLIKYFRPKIQKLF